MQLAGLDRRASELAAPAGTGGGSSIRFAR